jgi:hypothetical protein
VALLALRQRWSSAGILVWTFNIFGALDLLNAVAQGLRYTIDGHLGATYFIPAIFVPVLLVVHVVIGVVQIRHASPAHRQTALSASH